MPTPDAILITTALAILAWQGQRILRDLRILLSRVTDLEAWASVKYDFKIRGNHD